MDRAPGMRVYWSWPAIGITRTPRQDPTPVDRGATVDTCPRSCTDFSAELGELNRIHIIGRKNSGKTTLVAELVRCLTDRGMRVGTIKHTHHRHELDVPGKDSYKHRAAGAHAVAILSPGMTAVFRPTGEEPVEAQYERVAPLFADCALVLVEGDSRAAAPRLEVWRAATGSRPYAAEDAAIAAVITDDDVEVDMPIWPRLPIEPLAERILRFADLRTTH